MTKRVKYKRKGTLHVIAGLLVASAFLRIGSGSGAAFAESLVSPPPKVTNDVAAPDNDMQKDALLVALQEREARLQLRERALEDRLQAIAVAESEISEQLNALKNAEEALRATMAVADTAAESDLARLTSVYENMKPKEAAALFEEMSPEFSAGFLGRMRPEAAALIMTQLTPQTAYTVSVVLAGRNAGVPTE